MEQAPPLPLIDKGVDDPVVQIADGHVTSLDPPAEVSETPQIGPHRGAGIPEIHERSPE
jgi:hypothetical protein